MMPSYATNPMSTGVIDERNLDRLFACLEDARAKGAMVVALGGGEDIVNRQARKLPLSLVLDPRSDMEVMQYEIFGPILPVVTYRTLDEAIGHVTVGERPLALYVYTRKSRGGRLGSRTNHHRRCVR